MKNTNIVTYPSKREDGAVSDIIYSDGEEVNMNPPSPYYVEYQINENAKSVYRYVIYRRGNGSLMASGAQRIDKIENILFIVDALNEKAQNDNLERVSKNWDRKRKDNADVLSALVGGLRHL